MILHTSSHPVQRSTAVQPWVGFHSSSTAAAAAAAAGRHRIRHQHQRPTAASAGRKWGSNWSPKKDTGAQPSVRKPAPVDTTVSFARACNQLAQAVKAEFLKQGVNSSCIPVSAVFLEAVEGLGTGAEVKLQTCYLHVVQNKFLRHLRVSVDGQRFDVAGDIARAAIAAEGLPDFGMGTTDVLPPGATCMGWGNSPQPGGGSLDASAAQEAEMLQQLSTAEGRQFFWNGAPPQVLAARQQVLALSGSLKDKLS